RAVRTARFFVPGEETAGKKRKRRPEEKTRPHRPDADDHQPPKREAEAGPQAARAQAPRARGAVRERGRGPGRGGPGGGGLAAGAEPRFLLTAAGAGLGGEEVEPELLAAASSLGSGTRAIAVWPLRWAEWPAAPCVYLHGVGDPGNVGAVVRTAHALLD